MGLHNRPYMGRQGESHPGGLLGGGLPRPTRAVGVLLVCNVAVFIVQLLPLGMRLDEYFGATLREFWQPWRYLTFQFLHRGFWHIALNMLGLYLLGSPLERHFGTRRFTWFYLSCGAFAGVVYVLAVAAWKVHPASSIVGASGGVYAILLACAVLFPHFRLILLFFPVPIRLASVVIFGGMVFITLQAFAGGVTGQALSDACHLGGAAAAAVWLWALPRVSTRRWFRDDGRAVFRQRQRRQRMQEHVDEVLDKIRRRGMASLSWRERRLLRQASRQKRDDWPTA